MNLIFNGYKLLQIANFQMQKFNLSIAIMFQWLFMNCGERQEALENLLQNLRIIYIISYGCQMAYVKKVG